MKNLVLLILLFSSATNIYSQNNLMYKCVSNSQRDSISIDLLSKGYKQYVCDADGIYINLQSDNTFCYNSSLMGRKEVTFAELYTNVKIVKNEIVNAVETEIIEDNLCSDVEEKTDKFTKEISYNSPSIDNISFIKYVKKGLINQYVSIYIYDTYLSGYNNYGLTILFKSGKKIMRSKEKVDVNSSTGSNWGYSVFFTPTANEINLLKKEEIEAVKLYIFESNISQGDIIKKYANCVLVTPKIQPKKKK